MENVWRSPTCPVCGGPQERQEWNDEQGQHSWMHCLICGTNAQHTVTWTSTGTSSEPVTGTRRGAEDLYMRFKGIGDYGGMETAMKEDEAVEELGQTTGEVRMERVVLAEHEVMAGHPMRAYAILTEYRKDEDAADYYTHFDSETAFGMIMTQLRARGYVYG